MPSFVAKPGEVEKVVLFFSGGLDTSCMLKWIQERYKCEVVTMTVDVGQEKDFKAVEEKAYMLGAVKHYTVDAKEEFVREYCFRALKANALYQGAYPVSSSISRPLIAAKGVEVAHKEGADAVAHGCSGKGNDQIRFVNAVRALDPSLKVISPVVEWNLSRREEVEYAEKHGIPIPVDVDSPYSVDENLWGRSIECGPLEHPEVEPPEDVYKWTRNPEEAPEEPEYVEIEFEEGVPVKVDGKALNPVELVSFLNRVGGLHGVGRIDHMEDRVVGIKSREVYECPASTILIEAHKDLEKLVLSRRELEFKGLVDKRWTFLVYAGFWFDPLREGLERFIDWANERVCGGVKLKLYKGSATVVGRWSENGLYDLNLATYGEESMFDQRDSYGFIELWGLQSVMAYRLLRRKRR